MTTVTNPPTPAELANYPLLADTQYLEEMGSVSFNRKFFGIVPAGIYRGFDFSITAATTLRICPTNPNSAAIERDGQVITVIGQKPVDVVIPRSQNVAVVIEAISQHGLLTKQIDKNAAVDAAAIKVIPVANVLAHHVIICTVNLPATGNMLPAHISTATRQLGGLLNSPTFAQADARYQPAGSYATTAQLEEQAKKNPISQSSTDVTAAPESGMLIFDGFKDLQLPAAPEGSVLQVMVDRELVLSSSNKCRLLAPAGELIKTTEGDHDTANLAAVGVWFFFRRKSGVWKQL
jgi:hypothetical protein